MTADEIALIDAVNHNPDDVTPRRIYADWLRDAGREEEADQVAASSVVRDINLPEILISYDWTEVFGEGSGGNCSPKADACPPGAVIDLTPPRLEDIAQVIAASNGENDEAHWIGLFLLKDGRYCIADAWCDYTGWDCRADNNIEVAASMEDVLRYGLDSEAKKRLGFL